MLQVIVPFGILIFKPSYKADESASLSYDDETSSISAFMSGIHRPILDSFFEGFGEIGKYFDLKIIGLSF
jgi:hypothetical protein